MENFGSHLVRTRFTQPALALQKFPPMNPLMKLFSAHLFKTLVAASLLNVASSQAHEFTIGDMTINHPWARSTAPAAQMGVVYFSIKNSAAAGDTLLSVAVGSAIAKRASLHEMSMDAKGLMHMAEIKAGLAVAAKSEVKFAPGGYHVMLEGLAKPLVAKQEFGMTMQFAKAGAVSVIVLVE